MNERIKIQYGSQITELNELFITCLRFIGQYHIMISKEAEKKIEEMGIYFKQDGRTPMNGRVFGYLLLAEPPYKDFYEIQEALDASKSSVSVALNSLQQNNLVDYVMFKGNRRKHFRVNVNGWLGKSKERLSATTDFNNIIKSILEERAASEFPEFNKQLELMIAFHHKLEEVIKDFIIEWDDCKVSQV